MCYRNKSEVDKLEGEGGGGGGERGGGKGRRDEERGAKEQFIHKEAFSMAIQTTNNCIL